MPVGSIPYVTSIDRRQEHDCAQRWGWGLPLIAGYKRSDGKRLPTQLLANRSKFFAIAVCEPQAPSDLLAEEAILRQQILIAQPELLVERIGDRPQQFFPVHLSVHPCHDFLHW